ncbi:MAG: DUF1616 domain-containing protein, partial [Dehalococcoidia bacterium]
MDLIATILISLILVPTVELTLGIPRIAVGVLFLLLLPGYSLVAALYPSKTNVDWVERIFLALGLSMALVSLTGLVLNVMPWGIQLEAIIIVIVPFVLITSVIAIWRRRRLPPGIAYNPRVFIKVRSWAGVGIFDSVLYMALILATITAISVMCYVAVTPKVQNSFTEFFILGSEGIMENYRQEVVFG